MPIGHLLAHLFVPHDSNNQKARVLHSSSLIILAAFLILGQVLIQIIPQSGLKVLGFAANISPDEVIRLTNEKRSQAGLAPLVNNPTLSAAARAKGADMLAKGYWAHVAPDGTTPWKFFTNFGYKYKYAGENLARDFSNPSSAVDAWMASPSHKENLLSPKYKEIGIGVVEGSLGGVETTLVVQFFGAKSGDSRPSMPIAGASVKGTAKPVSSPSISESDRGRENSLLALSSPKPAESLIPSPIPDTNVNLSNLNKAESQTKVLVSPFNTTKNISLIVVGILLILLIIDAVITSRRRIARIGGRTFAHIAFLGMIMAVVLILKVGRVL